MGALIIGAGSFGGGGGGGRLVEFDIAISYNTEP